jgi:hypothetical protein
VLSPLLAADKLILASVAVVPAVPPLLICNTPDTLEPLKSIASS